MIEDIIQNKNAQHAMAQRRSLHQQRVDAFMLGAGQGRPTSPKNLDEKTRILRARLIFEEAMETINALGVQILVAAYASMDYLEGEPIKMVLNVPFERGKLFQPQSEYGPLLRLHGATDDEDAAWLPVDLAEDDDAAQVRFKHGPGGPHYDDGRPVQGTMLEEGEGEVIEHTFECYGDFNMAQVADGCCDIHVVTTGTLSAMGLADEALQQAVDEHNLGKLGPGHRIDEGGKLIKPPGYAPPPIQKIIDHQYPF